MTQRVAFSIRGAPARLPGPVQLLRHLPPLRHRLVRGAVPAPLRVRVQENPQEAFDERLVSHLAARRDALQFEVVEDGEPDVATPG